jgi:hypothetical protein
VGRKHLAAIGEILYIAGAYFATVWFAAAAVVPALALQCAFGATFLALGCYLILVLTDRIEGSILAGLLLSLPVTITFVGVLWWLARWVGLW